MVPAYDPQWRLRGVPNGPHTSHNGSYEVSAMAARAPRGVPNGSNIPSGPYAVYMPNGPIVVSPMAATWCPQLRLPLYDDSERPLVNTERNTKQLINKNNWP